MGTKFAYISLLLAALAICCLTSCVQNLNDATDINGNGGEGYIAVNLMSPSTGAETRAPGDTGVDGWENRINEVWMLLYVNNVLEYKFVWKVKNYNDIAPSELVDFYEADFDQVINKKGKAWFSTIPHKIKRKQYRVAVLANPSANVFGHIAVNSNLSALEAAISGGQQGLNINTFGSYVDDQATNLFFMSNANGLITINPDDLQNSKEDAVTKPITIHLDRLLAKVTVKAKTGGVDMPTPDVVMDSKRPMKWYLDVVNKRTYPIRHHALLVGGNEMETETNSVGAGRAAIYARDPNFEPAANNESNFVKWQMGDNPPYATWVSAINQDPALRTYQYTFENTIDLATQRSNDWSKYTTAIISEIHLIYKNLLTDPSNLTNENDPGRSYYSCMLEKADNTVQWMVFTHDQARYWLQTGFPTSTDAATKELYELLEKKIKEVQADRTGGNVNAFDFTTSASPGKDRAAYHTYKAVTYHPLGLNKYRSPIRHFDGSISANPRQEVYGYYGVVRNNMYTLTINSITGPGTGIYEWDNRFIATQINITPWYKRNFQGEDLE